MPDRNFDTIRRDLYRALRSADSTDFVRMVWSVRVLGEGRRTEIGDWFDYPQEAIGAEIGSRWYVPPWSLETLVNEYLTASMTPTSSNRRLNCRTWSAFSHVHNLLHDLEDVESVSYHADVEILDAIQRLGWRQFPWQQGMVNANKLFRSWYLYNFSESNEFLLERKGLTVENLTKIGFVAYSQFLRSHKIQDPESSPLGVSASDFRAVMNFVGNNMQKQRQLARSIRDRNTLVAYRPSVLRQRPVFITGFPNRPHYMCPLPELLVSRVAEGLFFDLVPKSDDIRRIIGERYESYCLEILGHYFSSSHSIIPQISYNNRVSPDILVLDRVEDGQHYNISAIIECKSKRISMRTRGSPLPAREVEGDIQEIAKGIYQIWKFFSAVRTFSDLDQYSTDEMTFGVVLTLEPWMEMAHTSIDRVFAMADEMADEQGGIEPVDRKPVTFVAIDDLEYCLARYSSDDILRELRRKCEREVQSYHLSSLLREENISLTGSERFSYFERLSEVCEWCHLFDTHMG